MRFLLLFLFFFVYSFDIEGCCCTSETIDEQNNVHLYSLLNKIRTTIFFRIYKVNLNEECQHFENNPMCSSESCVVQECCDEEVPEPWRTDEDSTEVMSDDVNFEWGFQEEMTHWVDDDENQWIHTSKGEDSFVDLSANPDGYTGYKGKEAAQIWKAIFDANCFAGIDMIGGVEQCTEERTFYRLISGFRTLTTALVFSNFPDENGRWGPSYKFYMKLLHEKDDFINNLYFGYVFLLRAVNKAAPLLMNYPIESGNPQEDFRAKKLFTQMLESDFIQSSCTPEFSFDESQLFRGERQAFKKQFRDAFRNISTILDCVGCEKCKLHAKLEFHGIGTALKILFSTESLDADNIEFLQRNEVIALVGALTKYADALNYVTSMRQLERETVELNKRIALRDVCVSALVGFCILAITSSCFQPPTPEKDEDVDMSNGRLKNEGSSSSNSS